MRQCLAGFALLCAAAVPAHAQTKPPPSACAALPPVGLDANAAAVADERRMVSSDAEVAQRVAQAKAAIKPGQAMAPGLVTLRAGSLHHAAVEYRAAPTPPFIHERMAEFFYVVDGAADVVLGGKLVNPRCVNSANITGTAIEGGETRRVAKGDYILVPENTAHYFINLDKKDGITVLDLHVPTPAIDQY